MATTADNQTAFKIPADTQTLNMLQWAAIVGGWLDLELLAALMGVSLEQIRRAAATAARQQILADSGHPGVPHYRFISEEARSALEVTLADEERTRRHWRVAEVLRSQAPDDQIAEQLAWHYEQAGDRESALRFAWRAAESALRRSAVESALEHYARALRLAELRDEAHDPLDEYALRSGHAECCRRLGRAVAEAGDLERMGAIADLVGDVDLQVEVLILQATLDRYCGRLSEARARAEQALGLARRTGDLPLQAEALNALGRVHSGLSNYPRAAELHARALELFVQLHDQAGEAASRYALGDIARLTGRFEDAGQTIGQAITLFRALGDRAGEADALNQLGHLTSDYAQACAYYEDALTIRRSVGEVAQQSRSYNNLGLVYWSLGLYSKARECLEQAVAIGRETGGLLNLAYCLESLGRVYLELGELEGAQQILNEGQELARQIGDRSAEAPYWLMLGRVALAHGDPGRAVGMMQLAADMQRELGIPVEMATSMSWLAYAHLELGDWASAEQISREAVQTLEQIGTTNSDYPAQDVWWLHYQILRAAESHGAPPPAEEHALRVLQRAYGEMERAVISLSDEAGGANLRPSARPQEPAAARA
jgi:tetratricopeptide (TPR) repeat protein